MTQDAAQPRRGAGLSVAGWPLRRKMALALAIPLLLAAVLGGLRVTGDYSDSRQAASSARQVTIIQPAIDYLTASEAAMVAAQTDSAASQGDLIDSISDIATSAETLVEAREAADLDERQTAHVDALLDLSQAMRGVGAENLGPATWIALVRQLESSVSPAHHERERRPGDSRAPPRAALAGHERPAVARPPAGPHRHLAVAVELAGALLGDRRGGGRHRPSRRLGGGCRRADRPPASRRTPATRARSATTPPPTSTAATPTRRTTRSPRRWSPA